LALTLLGLSGALTHDPSAALYIDGKLVAAAEEERFVRDKHAKNRMPYEAAKFCLEFAGIKPADVDAVAIPFAPISLSEPARWHYAKRYWYAPERALDAILSGNRRFHRYRKRIEWCLQQLGFDLKKTEIVPVEHHLAHAASAYHCAGFQEKTAILGIDGKGEYATTFFGYGENGRIHKLKEFYDPDSLGGLYGALTEYLGFEMLDGEYKVMGMAPYGDPGRYDFSRLAKFENGELTINTDYANVIGLRRYKENGKGYYFSPKLVDWLGPRRSGDVADDPYIHYAASMQKLFEDLSLQMIDYYLADILRDTGRLAFSGGGALNVKLNQKIIARPDVRELFVQPASGDAGTAVGAAAYVSVQRGVAVEKMEHVYLGPRVQQRRRDRRLCSPSGAACMATDRAGAAARRQAAGRRTPRGVVSGADGIWSARPRRPLDSGLPERCRRRRPDQRPDQVPRALATVLPEHARQRRAADVEQRTSRTVHDLHLRSCPRLEGTCPRSRSRRRYLACAGVEARVQPALSRLDERTREADR
jgi:carbamoyltransferase